MRYIVFICFILSMAHTAFAQTPPIPPNKAEALDALKERAEEKEKEKSALEKKVKSVKKKLGNTKQDMIALAGKIQSHETQLRDLEKRIANLEIRRSVMQDKLHADRALISNLILSLVHIRNIPPEAMIASPEKPEVIAERAVLMSDILPAINRHTQKLNTNLETLSEVSNQLALEKETMQKEAAALSEKQKDLENMIEERQGLYARLNDDIKAHEVSIQKISLQAKDLEQLVKRLKKEEQEERARKIAAAIKPKPNAPIPESSEVRLPISGIIRVGYDQKDDVGAQSHGLSIEGRSGGLVVAPISGKIQFTGSFKRYGNIVIIEHTGGYHSLVAGLEKISTSVGDIVKTGEPIGTLPNSSLIPRPTLYYELRRKGKPVDPSVKFSDLG